MSSQSEIEPVLHEENTNQKDAERDSSTLVPQEADSGYEASPSSTNDVCTFSFDGNQNDSNAASEGTGASSSQTRSENEREEFETSSPILMYYPGDDPMGFDEEDLVDVEGYDDDYTEESSLSWKWPNECPSVHATRDPDAESDQSRPSSRPIPIPLRDDSGRLFSTPPPDLRETHHRPCSQSLPSPTTVGIPSPANSAQLPQVRLVLPLPFSWPTTCGLFSGATTRSLFVPRANSTTTVDSDSAIGHRSNRPTGSTWTRSRRRLIDSDASSISSSEGEGPEEVFDDSEMLPPPLEEVPPLVSSAPSVNGHLLLPDVVPQSSSIGNVNGVRRSRSISVNFPLDRHQEETVAEIGRTLRRLSDQFDNQVRLSRGVAPNRRRFTLSELVRLTLSNLDSRVPRGDSDDESDGHPMANHVRRS